MMSTFALGPLRVRRSGYGAMQLAGSFAFGTPPDRASAIDVLQAAVADKPRRKPKKPQSRPLGDWLSSQQSGGRRT